jgi:hypothetical protein
VNAFMNLRAPYNAGNLSSGYITGDLSSSSQFHTVSEILFQIFRKKLKMAEAGFINCA